MYISRILSQDAATVAQEKARTKKKPTKKKTRGSLKLPSYLVSAFEFVRA